MSRERKSRLVAGAVFTLGLLLALSGLAPLVQPVFAASAAKVELSVANAGPREVEESTQNAIVRDYSNAWQTMTAALAENNDATLAQAFVGIAREKLAEKVASQRSANLRTRIVDKSHAVQAVFYSPEGSAMQLHDLASYEVQLVDGNEVVATEQVQQKFVVLMTVAEGRWKVRVLESVEN